MTIPPFDENGNLPPGVHWATWEEFEARFGTTIPRIRLINGLKQAMEQLKAVGCRTIYINGSFVTAKSKPKDFDACWDLEEVDMGYLRRNAPTLLNFTINRVEQKARYGGELFPSEAPVGDLGITSMEFFQRDRAGNRKGIVAIDLQRWEP